MKNPQVTRKRLPYPSLEEWVNRIRAGEVSFLSQAITLMESSLPEDRKLAEVLIQEVLPYSGNSIRIGITGVPGVGKSTFIEAFGCKLTAQSKKVAVLAVDPSSPVSGGSILGDKTRMEKLSGDTHAYIRPSPSGHTLGGVSARTRESILLCEAAGYEIILVETVGVGQSEVLVKDMTDFFLLLMLPGAGDELQGMKKGIIEMADLMVIHKADGDNLKRARRAQVDYQQALHLLPLRQVDWNPEVVMASSLTGEGLDAIWNKILDYKSSTQASGRLTENRRTQMADWFQQTLNEMLLDYLSKKWKDNPESAKIRQAAIAGQMNPVLAARKIFDINIY